ncbi:MAG TPA: calcium/sodium antiporter [Rhodospirillaceae bacterium]|nr:MAG: calcium/sodium antiporter [Alphaproteobacteria bacterium GWF2_58_20]HAU29314.1 calcium/sodium antiporter [Rhodospirillaceae bacterium]
MLLPSLSLLFGLALLVWSADRFVEGASTTARYFGMPPLLIGMVIVGFGTSAPEMLVSAISSLQGNPGLAIGNAYGSNITNIALILGLTALLRPITVHSRVVKKELPILAGVTALAAWQAWSDTLSRMDAFILLVVFSGLIFWTIRQQMTKDTLDKEVAEEMKTHTMPLRNGVFWLIIGLALLIASSKILVWGAVEIAHAFGVSDLLIGLTIVAVGTSLPELASSVVAARKGEHDIALGNIIGSNLFNTLAVVGIAGSIHPIKLAPEVFSRDIPVMAALTLSLFGICWGFKGKPGRISRLEGGFLLLAYIIYTGWLVRSAFWG